MLIDCILFQWPKRPWAPFQNTGPALSHPSLTIGFLGFGRISQSVLSRLLAFTSSDPSTPARAIYTSSRRRPNQAELDAELTNRFGVEVKYVDKEELAKESDVLVVLCDLNEGTKGLVGKEFLAGMKETAVLVNCARVSRSDDLAGTSADSTITGRRCRLFRPRHRSL